MARPTSAVSTIRSPRSPARFLRAVDHPRQAHRAPVGRCLANSPGPGDAAASSVIAHSAGAGIQGPERDHRKTRHHANRQTTIRLGRGRRAAKKNPLMPAPLARSFSHAGKHPVQDVGQRLDANHHRRQQPNHDPWTTGKSLRVDRWIQQENPCQAYDKHGPRSAMVPLSNAPIRSPMMTAVVGMALCSMCHNHRCLRQPRARNAKIYEILMLHNPAGSTKAPARTGLKSGTQRDRGKSCASKQTHAASQLPVSIASVRVRRDPRNAHLSTHHAPRPERSVSRRQRT